MEPGIKKEKALQVQIIALRISYQEMNCIGWSGRMPVLSLHSQHSYFKNLMDSVSSWCIKTEIILKYRSRLDKQTLVWKPIVQSNVPSKLRGSGHTKKIRSRYCICSAKKNKTITFNFEFPYALSRLVFPHLL